MGHEEIDTIIPALHALQAEGAQTAASLEDALALCQGAEDALALCQGAEEVIIMGGAQIYAQALPIATDLL